MSDLLVLNEGLETIVKVTQMMKGSKCNAGWFFSVLRMNFGKKEHGRKKECREGEDPTQECKVERRKKYRYYMKKGLVSLGRMNGNRK